MQQTPATVRIAAFFAAAAVTTLLATGQFDLARHYTGQADALLARQAVQQPLAQARTAAPRTPA